jgi:hypothetical protein
MLSNFLFGAMTVTGLPFTIAWLGASPSSAQMYQGNMYIYNVTVSNPSSNTYSNAYLSVEIDAPNLKIFSTPWNNDVKAQRQLTDGTWTIADISTYTEPSSGKITAISFRLPLPTMPPNYNGIVRFGITFATWAPQGVYNYNLVVSQD